MFFSTVEETQMKKSPEQKKKDIASLLAKHRKEMEAYLQQQAEFEERLEKFREQQRVLQIEMEAIREARQSLEQHMQEFERKQQNWRWRYGKGFFTPPLINNRICSIASLFIFENINKTLMAYASYFSW
jgi:predicted ribosome quality control (RQC) complex YloA/Tae2 family protein